MLRLSQLRCGSSSGHHKSQVAHAIKKESINVYHIKRNCMLLYIICLYICSLNHCVLIWNIKKSKFSKLFKFSNCAVQRSFTYTYIAIYLRLSQCILYSIGTEAGKFNILRSVSRIRVVLK